MAAVVNPSNPADVNFWAGTEILRGTYTDQNLVDDGIDPNTFRNGTYQDYVRDIPIQYVSKGMLLFHYFHFKPRNQYETDQNYKNRMFGELLTQYGVHCKYIEQDNSWEFCFGTTVSSQQYYYPAPGAGPGVHGLGHNYNACMISSTNRDIKLAYLKSGSLANENRIPHRRVPLNNAQGHSLLPNYDYKRVVLCNKFNIATPGGDVAGLSTCRVGNNYDVCLTREFQAGSGVDGTTSVAGEDSLMHIRKENGGYILNTHNQMFTARNVWRSFINHELVQGYRDANRLAWAMSLLCLESDVNNPSSPPNDQRINVGYREICFGPMGSRHATPDHIPPSPLPPQYGTIETHYRITDEYFENGFCSKRKIKIYHNPARMVAFVAQYFTPNLVVAPLSIATQHGSMSYDTVHNNFQYIPVQIGQPGEMGGPNYQQYQMNRETSLVAYSMSNHAEFSLKFDYRLNVFFLLGPPGYIGCFHDTTMKQMKYQVDPIAIPSLPHGHPLLNAPHSRNQYNVNFYMDIFNDHSLETCQYRKILHEIISNTKWYTHWMSEIHAQYNPNNPADNMEIPVGPYRNPLYLPFGTQANATNHSHETYGLYRQIINQVDPGGLSASHQIINNAGFAAYVQAWATNNQNMFVRPNNISSPGIQQYYLAGRWFDDSFIGNPAMVFQGGGKNNKTNNRTNNRTKRVRLSNRNLNKTKKNKRNNMSLSNRNIPKKSKQNMNMNTNKSVQSTNTNKYIPSMSSSAYSLNNNKKRSSTPTSNKNKEPVHTKNGFVPMDKDTFDTLLSIFNDKEYTLILDVLFRKTPIDK